MNRRRVILYFDLHSPFSYLAFYLLQVSPATAFPSLDIAKWTPTDVSMIQQNLPVFQSCEVIYKPVLLVAYIKAVGLVPPWSSPSKCSMQDAMGFKLLHDS
jgi:2-hydroxychromene-2-carboxylate isomerase